jgi:hypothetical protein
VTNTPDEFRAAAAALGADPDEIDELADIERRLSQREADLALGGEPDSPTGPLNRMGQLMPQRPSKPARLSRQGAARRLGEPSPRELMMARRSARHIAGEWRSRTLAQFQTKAGRVRLVQLLETQLTGTETEVPPGITEAIEHALKVDRTRTPDCPTLSSVGYARDTYRAIVRELKAKGKLTAAHRGDVTPS